MYELLDEFSVRTANSSYEILNNDEFLLEKIFVSSKSLYNQLLKYPNSSKTVKSLEKYRNRMRFRATPFGLMSSVNFLKFSEDDNYRTGMLIDSNFFVHFNIHPEWIENLINDIKKNNISKLSIIWNHNSNYHDYYGLYNNWATSVDKYSHIRLSYNYLIKQIKGLTLTEIVVHDLIEKLINIYKLGEQKQLLINIIIHLINNSFLLTDLDNEIFLNDTDALLCHTKKKKYTFNNEKAKGILEQFQLRKISINDFSIENLVNLEDSMNKVITTKKCLTLDTSTNIIQNNLRKKELEKIIIPFLNLANIYTSTINVDSRYNDDIYLFKENFGNVKMKFLDFYQNYDSYKISDNNNNNNNNNNYKILFKKIMIHIQFKPLKPFDLKHIKDKLTDESSALQSSPAFQMMCEIYTNVNNELEILLSPYFANDGLGKFEGRFSYINEKYFNNLKEINTSIMKEMGTDLATIKYKPKNISYNTIMNDLLGNDLNLKIGLFPDENTVFLKDLYIGVEKDLFVFYHVVNNEFKRIYFENFNTSNLSMLAPKVIEDLIYWSNKQFSSIMDIVSDLKTMRKEFAYFPEIKFNNLILINASIILENLIDSNISKYDFEKKVYNIKKDLNFPDVVFARIRDTGFAINLTSKKDLDILFEVFKFEKSNLILENYRPISNKTLTYDIQNNHYITEYVLNFRKKQIEKYPISNSPIYIDRVNYFNDEKRNWIQFNIYMDNKYQTGFIIGHLTEILNILNINKSSRDFFFIRYFKEREHIRIRFREHNYMLLNSIKQYLYKNNVDFSLGNYNPEIERYGGLVAINDAENFFSIDSLMSGSMSILWTKI